MLESWEAGLIEALRVARLATIGAGGRPHLVPVCYARVGDELAIPVDEKPKRGPALQRLRNIARDPRVALLFDRYDDDWSRLAWVRLDGDARVLERGDAFPEALAALRRRYPQYRAMALEVLPLIVVTPRRTVSWRAAPP